MQSFFITVVLFLFCQFAFAQTTYLDKKSNTHLWGELELDELRKEPFVSWYDKSYNAHVSNFSEKDASQFEDISVKIFIGTWCGDTKYLLPRFIKSWESMGLDMSRVELIGVHNSLENYKQGPKGETLDYNIHKVPTLIFKKDGKEVGRIVERSVFGLEEDMIQIVSNALYEERYQSVAILDAYINEHSIDSLASDLHLIKAYKKIRRELSSVSDLNAYGFVLMAQGELKKADFVFRLNKKLYPYNPNTHESYGDLLKRMGDLEGAASAFYEVLRIKKKDKYAIEQLTEIQKLQESTTLKS